MSHGLTFKVIVALWEISGVVGSYEAGAGRILGKRLSLFHRVRSRETGESLDRTGLRESCRICQADCDDPSQAAARSRSRPDQRASRDLARCNGRNCFDALLRP